MEVSLKIASAGKETGALLKELLQKKGIYSDKGKAVVSYGIHLVDRYNPTILNGVCARGKIYNMTAMTEAGVKTVPWFQGENISKGFKFPAFARKSHGCGGEDLIPVFQKYEIPWRVAAGWDWFSSYVPFETEYRVWVFKGQHLDTYEKVMQRPGEYKFMGRNFRNGFEFQLATKRVPDEAVEEAIKAVRALQLDFAAIDLLWGSDQTPYILEANTAPGVIRSGAQKTLGKLADKIEEWAGEL